MKELPIACTLSPAGMAERGDWLQRLGAESLRSGKRRGEGLDLRFDPGAEADVRRWVRAEGECCAFLDFDVDPAADELRVGISGPPGAEAVLDGLLTALTS